MIWRRLRVWIAAGIAVAGAGGLASGVASRVVLAQSTSGSAPARPAAPNAVPVQLASVKKQDVPVLLSNIGAVQPYQSVLVRSRVDGTLTHIYFTEGQMVKPGDKLAEIDPRPYAAVLAQAMAKKGADTAMLASAQKDLSRYTSLVRSDFASHQQLDQQTGTVGQLQATLQGDDATIATAQLNLDFCNITSPIEGRTGLRLVDIGNLIHANDATGIVNVSQLHPIAVTFTLPQDDLPRIQDSMRAGPVPVYAFTADDKTKLGDGKLLTIDNSIDQTTGTIKLKAEFPNQDNHLWPGQFVNVRMQSDMLHNAVTVPSAAVQRGPQGLYVYLVKPDQTVAMQAVEVRQDDGKIAVIAKGLDDGVQVVTNGQSRLQTGSHVVASNAGSAT